jgi:hypothetical protein
MVERGDGAIVNVTTMVAEFGIPVLRSTDPAKPLWCC